jgi:hypothetical protein
MCQAISGIVVKSGDDVKVYTLHHSDSHEDIRNECKIKDDLSASSQYQTPVELVPVRDLFNVDGMDFKFDAERPTWWTDEMTNSAIRQLHKAWMNRWDGKTLVFNGNLDLSSLTTLPEGVTLESGGNLDLSSLTTLPEGVTLKLGGNLDLSSLTTLPEGVTLKLGGNLYLGSLTTLPEGVTLKSGGNLYLRSLTTEQKHKFHKKHPTLKIWGFKE